MAREFGPVNVEIWSDPDFRALPPAAQHLYLLLWTSPGLSYCGVHDWRPGRLANLSRGFTAEHVATVGDCLQARHFLVIDDETEEVLVRSWARFDGLMKQPRMAVSYANAYATVASPILRSVMVYETHKIREALPDLACWRDKRVTALLEHPAVSAKDLPTPEDPFGDEVAPGFALGLPQTAVRVSPRVSTGPTPAPTPAPSSSTPKDVAASKPAAPPEASHLCNLLADLIEANGSNRPEVTKKWLDDARLMLQRDGRKPDQAEHLIRWCQADTFWRTNVLSMTKFRQKYDQLRLQARSEWERGRAAVSLDGDIDVDAILGAEKFVPPPPPDDLNPGTPAWQQWHHNQRDQWKADRERRAREIVARRSA